MINNHSGEKMKQDKCSTPYCTKEVEIIHSQLGKLFCGDCWEKHCEVAN